MAQNENKLKHLELIQAVVTRMSSNSFLLKAWSVTLIAALFALAAKDANHVYVLIAYIPVCIFWGLDGYFLSHERRFRSLYDEVRLKSDTEINFNMNPMDSEMHIVLWAKALFSVTLIAFYVPLIVLTVVINSVAK